MLSSAPCCRQTNMHCFKAIAGQFGQIMYLRHAAKIHIWEAKKETKIWPKPELGKGIARRKKTILWMELPKFFSLPPFLPAISPLPLFLFSFGGEGGGAKGGKTFFLPQSLVCTVYGAAACCTYCTRRLRWWGGLYLGVWRRRGKKVSGGGGNKTLVPATQAQTVESAGKLKLRKHKLRNGFLWDPAAAARAPFSHHYVFKCLKYPP